MKDNTLILEKIFKLLYFIWGFFVLCQETVNISISSEVLLVKLLNIFVILFSLILLAWMAYQFNITFNLYSILAIISILVLIFVSFKNQVLVYSVNFVFVLLASKVNYKEILKAYMLFSSIVLFGTIILHYLGFIPDFFLSFDNNTRIRSSLGFSYYTFSAQIFFFLLCAVLVYKGSKISYREIIVLELVNIFIYINTDTRNPYQLGTFLLCYTFLKKLFRLKGIINHKYLRLLLSWNYPLAFLTLYFITFKTSANTFFSLNNLLSNRLVLNVSAFNQFGVRIFGQKIQFSNIDALGGYSKTYNYVDTAYFQNLIVNGWLFTFILIFFFTFLSFKALKRKNDILLVVLAVIAIHAMFDPQLDLIWYSPFALLFLNDLKDYKNDTEVKIQDESGQKLSL